MTGFCRFVRRMLWHGVPVIAALIALLGMRWVDTELFPVVDGFVVNSITPVPQGVVVSGIFTKKRACEIVAVSAYADSLRLVPIHVPDRQDKYRPAARAVRTQSWGPWIVDSGEASTVTITAEHRCHFMWNHTTELATFQTGRDK